MANEDINELIIATKKYIEDLDSYRQEFIKSMVRDRDNLDALNNHYEGKEKVSEMLEFFADSIILVLNLLPTAITKRYDTQLNILHLIAELYRIQASFKCGEKCLNFAFKCLQAYMDACMFISSQLAPNHPKRTEMALSFTILFNELKVDPILMCNNAVELFKTLTIFIQTENEKN